MSSAWSVDGEDLKTKPRTGGAIAEKGFAFQKAYALVRLTWLPAGERGLVELRYEGAQDVDLRFSEGREVLTQAKDHQPGSFSYAKLKDVIAGFTRDLITATVRGRTEENFPKFRLVCTSAPYEESSFQILRRVYMQDHAEAIEPLIRDEYREGLGKEQVLRCVLKVLECGEFEIIVHEEAIEDLKAQASWNLVKFGVPPEHVHSSLARLQAALVPRATFQVSDVVENLVGLPEGHPGKDGAACRLLPAKHSLELTSSMRTAFLHGAVQSLWSAISNGLDVPRSEIAEVTQVLRDVQTSGGMVVVEGNQGTGKSALIRRVAWDAHRAGTHLVLEVVVPSEVDDANWKAIINLLSLSTKPLLLLIDDVWRHREFVLALERQVRSNLCVLATSRPVPASQKSDLSVLTVHLVRLGKLSDDLVRGLRRLVRVDESTTAKVSTGQVARFMEHGQLLALSLTLQGGSLNKFAEGVLRPLRSKAAFEDFLDLCVAGRYDQSAPLSLFDRCKPDGLPFWKDESFFGLVAVQKTNHGVSRLKVGHSLVAQAIVEVGHVNLVDRAIHLCTICNAEMVDERRFVVRLLRDTLADPDLNEEAKSKGKLLATAAHKLLEHASFSDAHRLASMLLSVEQPELSQKFLAVATADRVVDVVDIGLALSFKRRKDFEELYPRILEFFEHEANAPGRRRFVTLVQNLGSPAQQLAVIEQTANWAIHHDFPAEETLAIFTLGVSAPDREVVLGLAPMIRNYLESDTVAVEILSAAISPTRRMKDTELSRNLIQKIISLIQATVEWRSRHRDLVRRAAQLVTPELDEATRGTLGAIIIATLEAGGKRSTRIGIVNAAIVVAAVGTIKPIRRAISAMKAQGWKEAYQLERHFKHQFKLK
ncbi:hypothetical protein [Pseudomonas laurylsulfatiphila]|uniref:P-loop NTPase n=1 Tax=Pseudomonas laurylsulfatiphila TaxID=2011015 RepID=UPI002160FAD3|nr:hypothetical protein [Pseudomonas laurylsulfatiphila]UVM05088.1 hypothetical protein LOY25_29545 [Pseudomonas laurylsulfatiphila]